MQQLTVKGRFLSALGVIGLGLSLSSSGSALNAPKACEHSSEMSKRLLWGDLHVHTGNSLDAYAFGVRHTPADAFAFGKGQSLLDTTGELLKIDRPLDFMAVTDHAESFSITYLCGDPGSSNTDYCQGLRDKAHPKTGLSVFRNYLIPLLVVPEPKLPTALCDTEDCTSANSWQWQRAVRQANDANEPCEFTAFIGQEWSGTPGGAHTHRNVIYRTESVPNDTFDYLRYPSPKALWSALDEQCVEADGCRALAIPHNSNLAEGLGFDIETESPQTQALRSRYERVAEVFQSKGQSECLEPEWTDESSDCSFEVSIPASIQKRLDLSGQEAADAWSQLRRAYLRDVLNRGLGSYQVTGRNPLQLGFIGSTDTHSANAGDVTEDDWSGDVWSQGEGPKGRFRRLSFNPGGLVGVWAKENTRESIFDALHEREVFATSGPRISLRVFADDKPSRRCESPEVQTTATVMGGTLAGGLKSVHFTVIAQSDQRPLQSIELVKSEADEQVRTKVLMLAEDDNGRDYWCVEWQDPDFDPSQSAYWYVRAQETPSPRWSKVDCQKNGLCQDYPEANTDIQERAWSSPIWYYPE